jgi:hypothetical protein
MGGFTGAPAQRHKFEPNSKRPKKDCVLARQYGLSRTDDRQKGDHFGVPERVLSIRSALLGSCFGNRRPSWAS